MQLINLMPIFDKNNNVINYFNFYNIKVNSKKYEFLFFS